MKNTVFETEIITELISTHYTIGQPTHCELIPEGFNHNYLIETTNNIAGNHKYVLRMYLNGKYYIRDADDFRFELDLLNFLLDQGVPVVRPIANQAGEWLTTHHFLDHVRHMVLFHLAPGVELGEVHATGALTPDNFKEVGKVAARIHQATDRFQSHCHRYQLNCSTYLLDKPLQILEKELAKRKMGNLSFFRPFAEQLRQQVEALARTTPTYGLIHADLHGHNIFLDTEAGMTIIDFDHCAYSWRAYEFATWGWDAEALATVIEGYESVQPLSKLEKELIPTFVKLRWLWDIGDMLAYHPLWGTTPPDEHLEDYVKELHDLM